MTTPAIPDSVRKILLRAAILLAGMAAVGNFGHVRDFAAGPGHASQMQAVVAAVLPDVLLIGGVIRLRYDDRSVPAWIGLVISVAFVGWAAVTQAGSGWPARAVAVWPILVAVIAACLIEAKPAPGRAVRPARTPERATRPQEARTPEPAQKKPVQAPKSPAERGTAPAAALTASRPAPDETTQDTRRRLTADRAACVDEVRTQLAAGRAVSQADVANAYGAGTTWAKSVRAEAAQLRAVEATG